MCKFISHRDTNVDHLTVIRSITSTWRMSFRPTRSWLHLTSYISLSLTSSLSLSSYPTPVPPSNLTITWDGRLVPFSCHFCPQYTLYYLSFEIPPSSLFVEVISAVSLWLLAPFMKFSITFCRTRFILPPTSCSFVGILTNIHCYLYDWYRIAIQRTIIFSTEIILR